MHDAPETGRRVRIQFIWINQRGETVAEGEALVIPPPRQEELLSEKTW
jgi:hypothetical protein